MAASVMEVEASLYGQDGYNTVISFAGMVSRCRLLRQSRYSMAFMCLCMYILSISMCLSICVDTD
jgi:hypothetical protein